jgi:hypothetical protein
VQAGRERRRVFALFLAVLVTSVAPTSVLIGIPLLVLLLAVPTRRLPGLLAGAAAALLAFGWAPRDALWYAERGWAILLGGWFAAVTLRWPGTRFFPRALGSVGGALGVTLLVLSALTWAGRSAPGGEGAGPFQALDSLVAGRGRAAATLALESARELQERQETAPEEDGGGGEPAPANGEEPLPVDVVELVYRMVEFHTQVYPAMLGLASLAALGVAWWVYVRFARGLGGALGPLREFRFNDHLVWLFISGLAMVLVGQGEVWRSDLWVRTGSNAALFMGALYAVRGAAVVQFMSGGISLMGFALVTVVLLLVAPVMMFAALVVVAQLVSVAALIIGLGDTWLDLRGRVGQSA